MASMSQRSMSAVSDLGLVKPTDLPDDLLDTEEQRKKRELAKKTQAPGIISPSVQALLGGGLFNGL